MIKRLFLICIVGLVSLAILPQLEAADTTIKGTGATSATAGLEVTNSADTSLLYVRNDGNVGIGTTSPDRLLHPELSDATTNSATYPLRLTHVTSGTPANNIGVGLEFEVETAADNNELGAIIEAVATDTTATSEDFDIVFKNMAAGAAAAETFRVDSLGNVTATGTISGSGISAGGDLQLDDNQKLLLGTGSDASVYYDGSNMYIDPNEVGSGSLIIQPTSDSTTGFQILDADGGTPILNVDTTNERVGIGTTEPNVRLEIDESVLAASDNFFRITGTGFNTDNRQYGAIQFYNKDVSSDGPQVGAQIEVRSANDGVGSGRGGSLAFLTATGATSVEGAAPIEAMRINYNGNVGIGTTAPANPLTIDGSGGTVSSIGIVSSSAGNAMSFYSADAVVNFDGNGYFRSSGGSSDLIFQTNGANTRMFIKEDGNVGIGTTSFDGTAAGVLALGNATAPAAGTADQCYLWAEDGDTEATSNLWVMDEAGNATEISPHDPVTGEWIFYSKNVNTGRVVRVDMEKLVHEVERLSGKKFLAETFEQVQR